MHTIGELESKQGKTQGKRFWKSGDIRRTVEIRIDVEDSKASKDSCQEILDESCNACRKRGDRKRSRKQAETYDKRFSAQSISTV